MSELTIHVNPEEYENFIGTPSFFLDPVFR